ncbi:MAG: YcaO-like family protein [Deltaproteobacteria bacterium]|nr:YcaO-like family protein [Deltaproteobacteria bacterium]
MEFQNCIRNKYGKCDLPSNTIGRIKDGLRKLNLDVEYSAFSVSDNIYWGRIWIDSIRIVCNGKGITPELAEASAYAELAERFSAGLFYPVFEERVRFNVPALYNKETNRFLNFEWMKGYVYAHQDDLIVHEETVKIPANFVAYIHASNGMAAGNTIEEAMIQALCEIFERYAQIQTIKPEKIVPSIDLNSVDNAVIKDIIKFYHGKNVDVIIKDLSFDGLLPCIGVLFINHNLPPDRLEHRILIPGTSFNLDEGLQKISHFLSKEKLALTGTVKSRIFLAKLRKLRKYANCSRLIV